MRLATHRSFAVLSVTSVALLLAAAVQTPAAQNAKGLNEQEVVQLLEGGVPSARVSSIIDERGIVFRVNSSFEQKVRDAGGGDDVIASLRRASQRYSESEAPRTGGLIIKSTPGETQVYLDDEPKGMTSPEGEIRLPDLKPRTYKLRVSLPGYQSFEKALAVEPGQPQTVYVTLSQRSAGVIPDNPAPSPQTPTPSEEFPVPGVKVSAFQFFEGPHDTAPEQSQRVYRTNFARATTRSIYWELDLGFPAPARKINFQLDAIWYKPDGSELHRQTFAGYVMPTWPSSIHTLGYGWVDAGNWPTGSYRVDVFYKNLHLASKGFTIN